MRFSAHASRVSHLKWISAWKPRTKKRWLCVGRPECSKHPSVSTVAFSDIWVTFKLKNTRKPFPLMYRLTFRLLFEIYRFNHVLFLLLRWERLNGEKNLLCSLFWSCVLDFLILFFYIGRCMFRGWECINVRGEHCTLSCLQKLNALLVFEMACAARR